MISVVIPLRNEGNSFPTLWQILNDTLSKTNLQYEIIVVDDFSDPQTLSVLKDFSEKHSALRLIRLNEHKGQTKALWCGFASARGDLIFSIDADLQDNPVYIPDFIGKLEEGYDAVCGHRVNRTDTFAKKLISYIGNFVQRSVLGTGIHDLSCTFRLYRRHVLNDLPAPVKGFHRFIPYFIARKGHRITEIPIHQGKRSFGRSHYRIAKSLETIILFFRVIAHK